MVDVTSVPQIAGYTLEEWTEMSRRDDCFAHLNPSDLRALVGFAVKTRDALSPFASAARDGFTVYHAVKIVLDEKPSLSTHSSAYIDAGRVTAQSRLSWNDFANALSAHTGEST